MTTGSDRHRLLIAGAGVAGLEALVALAAVARDRLEVTVLGPDPDFRLQAMSVGEPFSRPRALRHSVAAICADHDATYVEDSLAIVEAPLRAVTTAAGTRISYDSMLVAVGAARRPVFPQSSIVFRGDSDAAGMRGLVRDIEDGYAKRVVFVVPSGVTWPLPLYELAMMTAHHARESGHDDVSVLVVTPEEAPLGVFGATAAAAVAAELAAADVEVLTSSHVERIHQGKAYVAPGRRLVAAGRVVTIPRLTGPAVVGLPSDDDGFIPVDAHGRVRGVDNVFAAGDGTTFPIKQGGVGAQQADAAALAIARRAGVNVVASPFDPVLRAKVLTGAGARYLGDALQAGDGGGASAPAGRTEYQPEGKVAAPYLSGYLEGRAGGGAPAPAVV